MTYIRNYPTKCNTIFKNKSGYKEGVDGLVNTSQNPVMELRDGGSKSILLFQFDLEKYYDKLSKFEFNCNLCLFDSGSLYEPAILPKNIDLIYFEEEWVEGDGYGFENGNFKTGVSNWNKRDSVNNWDDVLNQNVIERAYHLNNIHEDLCLNINQFIQLALDNNKKRFSIGIRINEEELENSSSIFTKYINSIHTRTVFKPFVELFIKDEIIDNRNNIYPEDEVKLFLRTESRKNLDITKIKCSIYNQLETEVIQDLEVNEWGDGCYYANFTATLDGMFYEKWYYGETLLYRKLLTVNSLTKIQTSLPFEENLFFYPVHPSFTVQKGDVIRCFMIAEIRHKKDIAQKGFKYRVIQSNGFEMIPWTDVNVLHNKMYFYINTEFFFPDIEYIIQAKYEDLESSKTSDLVHKFKIITNDKNKLDKFHASPYNSRDFFLRKK